MEMRSGSSAHHLVSTSLEMDGASVKSNYCGTVRARASHAPLLIQVSHFLSRTDFAVLLK